MSAPLFLSVVVYLPTIFMMWGGKVGGAVTFSNVDLGGVAAFPGAWAFALTFGVVVGRLARQFLQYTFLGLECVVRHSVQVHSVGGSPVVAGTFGVEFCPSAAFPFASRAW